MKTPLLFKKFFDLSTEMMCIANHEGYFVKTNASFREKLGYTEKELLSVPYVSLIHEEEVESTIAEAQALANNQIHTYEFVNRYKKKNGEYIQLSWNVYSDEITGLIYCVVTDVTERQQKESRLRKIELFYREAQKAAKIGSWEVDLRTNEVFWSEETYKIHEVPADYKPILEEGIRFYDEKSRPIVEKFVNNAFHTGEGWEFTLGINTFKGNHKWVRSIGHVDFDDSGKPIRIAGIFQDVTEAKEKEVKREEFLKGLKMLNKIASNANLTPEDQINEALSHASGYLELPLGILSKIKGEKYEVLHLHNDDSSISLEPGAIFELGETYCSIAIREKDVLDINHMKESKYTGHPCYQAFALETYIGNAIQFKGKVFGTINFSSPYPRKPFEDYEVEFVRLLSRWLGSVLELKIHQEDIVKAKVKAEKAAAAKTEFLSVMSHEIRTPLNSVIGMSNLLLLDNPMDYQLENLSVLKSSSENLLSLINDILDFNKLESGNFELNETPTNLKHMVSEAKQSFDYLAKEKGIDFKLKLEDEIPTEVLIDSNRINQVILNLLSNAIKFTEKGEVGIEVNMLKKDNRKVKLLFRVYDTGIGIEEKDQEKIFESFTQASSSTTREYGGTGLGLAITKNILSKMASTITLKSRSGEGSVFSFVLELPYVKEEDSSPYKSSKLNEHVVELRILVAEDNEFNRVMVSKFLDRWGVQHEFALNGKEAVEKNESNQYDVVFMDLQMPVMDGYEASKIIKDTHPDLPIIALTASSELEIQKKAKNSGMDSYITKPFTPKQLLEKLQEINVKLG